MAREKPQGDDRRSAAGDGPLRVAIVNDYAVIVAGVRALLAPRRYRVDVVEPVVDLQGRLRPEHEGRLRQPVGAGRVRSDDGRAAHLACGVAGVRVDDVMVTHAAFVKEAVVVPGRRHRRINERQPRHDLVRVVRMAYADDPGAAVPIADYPAVAARGDERMRDAERLQVRSS